MNKELKKLKELSLTTFAKKLKTNALPFYDDKTNKANHPNTLLLITKHLALTSNVAKRSDNFFYFFNFSKYVKQ